MEPLARINHAAGALPLSADLPVGVRPYKRPLPRPLRELEEEA